MESSFKDDSMTNENSIPPRNQAFLIHLSLEKNIISARVIFQLLKTHGEQALRKSL